MTKSERAKRLFIRITELHVASSADMVCEAVRPRLHRSRLYGHFDRNFPVVTPNIHRKNQYEKRFSLKLTEYDFKMADVAAIL